MPEFGKANLNRRGPGEGGDEDEGQDLSGNKGAVFAQKTRFVDTNNMNTMEYIQNTEDNEELRDSQNNLPSSGSQVSGEEEAEEFGINPRPKKVVVKRRELGELEGMQEEPERGQARKRTLVRKPTEITPLKVASPLPTKSAGKLGLKGKSEVKGRLKGRTATLPGNKY